MVVAVYGASSRELDAAYLDAAFQAGAALAKRGHAMVYGAGQTGVMGAAARGMASEGGRIVGVAPRFFDQPGVLYQSCAEMIFTETMSQRKQRMEDLADAFLVLPGGIGTLEEFFETLTLRHLGRHEKPIALLNVNGCWDALDALMQASAEERFTPAESLSLYRIFTDVTEALDYLEARAAPPERSDPA